jgi:hypothetical protein
MLADQATSSLHSQMENLLQMWFVAKHQFAPYPSIVLPHIRASFCPMSKHQICFLPNILSTPLPTPYLLLYLFPYLHGSLHGSPPAFVPCIYAPPILLVVYICHWVPSFRTQPIIRLIGLGERFCHPTQNPTHHYTHRVGLGQTPTRCVMYVKYSLLNLQSTEYFTVRIF